MPLLCSARNLFDVKLLFRSPAAFRLRPKLRNSAHPSCISECSQVRTKELASSSQTSQDSRPDAQRLFTAGEFEAMQDAIGTGSLTQAEMLARLISRVASLEAAVTESQGVRRDLHNQLVSLRGNVGFLPS